jgi:hypothetical protein
MTEARHFSRKTEPRFPALLHLTVEHVVELSFIKADRTGCYTLGSENFSI